MARYWIANTKAGFASLPKGQCPACGRRRLSRYFDRKTGELMDDEYGRCERVNSCGYDNDPNKILWSATEEPYRPRPLPPPVEKPQDYRIPMAAFDSTFRDHSGNLLMAFLRNRFDSDAADHVLSQYCVGTYTGRRKDMHGSAFFWLINADGEVVTGHAIKYGPDGRRDKSQSADNLWAHHAATGKTASELGVPEVWFGEHLISAMPSSVVGVVESEKTAIICSILYPGMLWLATGGESKLTRKKMRLLRGRHVVLFPDAGAATSKWIELADDLSAYFLVDGSLSVSTLASKLGRNGDDIADLAVSGLLDGVEILPEALMGNRIERLADELEDQVAAPAESAIDTMKRTNPAVARFIDALGLEVLNP